MAEYYGLEIKANDDVYEPSDDSLLAAEVVEECVSGKIELEILDMGTGSGILGLVAAKSRNVSKVVFADISDKAIDAAHKNFEANRDKINAQCDFVISDLFSKINGRFDLIIFNAPYLKSDESKSKLALAWNGGETGVELTKKFIEESMSHLKKDSKVIVVASSVSDLESLKKNIAGRFRIVKTKKTHYFFEDIIVFLLEPLT